LYRDLQSSPSQTKAAALQSAQLALLRGTASPTLAPGKDNRAGRAVEDEGDAANLPLFKTDPAHPYAHPYYWAPFVLIGNWK
nr:CHAT domain-containing protein [Armatimonadota bacterium]